jgi:hypothetical protein
VHDGFPVTIQYKEIPADQKIPVLLKMPERLRHQKEKMLLWGFEPQSRA